MKTEISRDSHQPKKRYSGVFQQQGRMLTDADWNELVEILKERLNDALKDVVGNGSPLHRNIVNNETDPPELHWGYVHVDGIQALVRADEGATLQPVFEYDHQQDFPSAPTPPVDYILYADVWERTVTHLMDERLRDKGLHGADTCTRKQMMAQVKWCPDNVDPEQSAGNPAKGNAELTVTLLQKTTQPDPCDPCASQVDVESKVGNYLFRVEIHDVKGDANSPTEITLKWSSENAAEQFEALPTKEEMPAGFISDKWVYEFFDQTSEKHLGIHLENTSWEPSRVVLAEIKEPSSPYTVPTISGSNETETFVRRWDGYCRLDMSGTGSLISGVDRGVVLSTTKDVDSLGYVNINGSIQLVLDSIKLDMALNGKTFVAGDYWLADVREAEHKAGSELILKEMPLGIEHHYLMLGQVVGGVQQPNPEADRKYAFPPLTEMTRMFMAGGDGQEVVPGDPLNPLPQPLRVAVANGEWPVKGVTVRFHTDTGTLNPADGKVITTAEGIAECIWTPGDIAINPPSLWPKYKVKATLVAPDDGVNDLKHPPVYFYASLISADQVAYDPGCPDSGQNAVHSHLVSDPTVSLDLGIDGYYTVKEVLDALLCKLKAKHIPYDPTNLSRWNDVNAEEGAPPPDTVQQAIDDLVNNLQSEDIKYTPGCTGDTPPTVRSKLGIPDDSSSRVHQIFNKLLCDFNATHLPVDRTNLCSNLAAATGNEQVDTVQDAINALCRTKQGGGCCTISISPGDDIAARLTNEIKKNADAHICITNGVYIVQQPVLLEGLGHITIQGCGDGTVIRSLNSESAIILSRCKSVVVRNLTMQSYKLGNKKNSEYDHLNGVLTVRDVEDVVVEAVSLSCPHGVQKMASCLSVTHRDKTSSVRIKDCQLNPGHQQVGILLVNANLARIEGNEVNVRQKPRKAALKKRLKNKHYRLPIRKMIMSDVVVVDIGTKADKKRNVEIEFNNRLIRFKTQDNLVNGWKAYLGQLFLGVFLDRDLIRYLDKALDRDLIRYIKKAADNILLTLAAEGNIGSTSDVIIFRDWFDAMKSHLPAIASQGIVCGGRIANDICITRNSIHGVSQGVHIGLSHNDSGKSVTYYAGRLLVTENHVANYLSSQMLGERHGLFVGNFECLHVENNYLELKKFPYDLQTSISGIRVYGFFGDMMQVRGNRLKGYASGIFAKALNPAPINVFLWQVENNLLGGASGSPVLVPQSKFIATNNPH